MVKFLVDRMLGQTAKWLRLMGIDAEYAPEGDDDKLLNIAEEEDRVIITRDKDLGGKDRSFLVPKKPPEEIIPKILSRFDVEIDPMTRCSKCNGVIEEADKKEIESEVPEGVYERNDIFWRCPDCGQIYWEGSHWDNIWKTIDEIEGKIE